MTFSTTFQRFGADLVSMRRICDGRDVVTRQCVLFNSALHACTSNEFLFFLIPFDDLHGGPAPYHGCWYFAAPLRRGKPIGSEHPLPCCVFQASTTHGGQTEREIRAIWPVDQLGSRQYQCVRWPNYSRDR